MPRKLSWGTSTDAPDRLIVNPGTSPRSPVRLSRRACSNVSLLKAETATGTDCSGSARFCAVTIISCSIPAPEGWSSDCGVCAWAMAGNSGAEANSAHFLTDIFNSPPMHFPTYSSGLIRAFRECSPNALFDDSSIRLDSELICSNGVWEEYIGANTAMGWDTARCALQSVE